MKSDRMGLRVTPEKKSKWKKEASRQGLSLSAWVERTLDMASFRPKPSSDAIDDDSQRML